MKINRFSAGRNMKRRWLAVIGILAMLVGLLPGSVFAADIVPAQVVEPVPGPALTVNVAVVNDGAGGQSDPHVSGDWVSYTNNSVYEIRYQNLDLGVASDRLIPRTDGMYDSLSDISGNTIVFMRASGGYQSIHLVQIDPFGNPGAAVEVSPSADALRGYAAIDGGTIAYEDRGYGGSSAAPPEISLSSAVDPAAPAYRLTNDTLADQLPAVSPDGNAIVWVKCADAYTCNVWRAERTAGVWGSPEQVTGAAGNASFPDTNGQVTVYGSTAGGDSNIRWSVKDSGAYVESVLALPGVQRNPYIAGNFITFESSAGPGLQIDIWLYDLATNRLFQLTNTLVSETLTDITTGPGGLVRVVWAEPKQVYPYDMDVYALSAVLPALDTTPPAITPTVSGTLGANGWYTSDVSLTWSVADPESAISTSGCEDVSITQDQAATGYTCSATSDGGSASMTVSIARDASAPVISCPNSLMIPDSGDQTVTASVDAAISGLDEAASILSGTVPTSSGWPQTLTFTAVDLAGNTAMQECMFNQIYSFTGFFYPVKNVPSVNVRRAGGVVPIKFSLAGDQGLDILADGFPKSQPVSCGMLATFSGSVDKMTAASGPLTYDPATDQYIYVWKTNKGWAGTCRVLTVQLDDGTQHLAYFRFK